MIHLRPIAKINLGLFIKNRRPDGYHELETLLVPYPDLADDLVLEARDTGCTLQISGLELDGDPADNLCVKAYHQLKALVPSLPGVHIHLTKQIPAGAGLGGGSSDAAYVLRGLNQLFDLGLSVAELSPLAARLGADVPFFLHDAPMMATGTGTDLSPFPFSLPGEIRLFPQSIHSSTIAAYKALDINQCDPHRSLEATLQQSPAQWQKILTNDLEAPVFGMYPALKQIKADLYADGALYAAMSGSGSAMFGIF
ncbi:MAG: 4-(cytidine 5'-diphospho)-2-C-methyl-D-erythritol kinase [Bacteroidota bacterium]